MKIGDIADADTLRRRHQPSELRVLFIGESLPAGGTFFYAENSILYHATKRAFTAAIPDVRDHDFLVSFARLGCYLDDLCLEPVNRMEKHEKGLARIAGEGPLAERLRRLSPGQIVIVGKGIEVNVRRAIRGAGLAHVPVEVVPFPNWPKHVAEFNAKLGRLVGRLRQER